MSRAAAAVIVVASLSAACTSGGKGTASSSAPTNPTTSQTNPTTSPTNPTAPVTGCTRGSAEAAREAVITTAGFAPSCVRIKVRSKFFFVDNEKKHHTATTRKGSPEAFDADLRTKGSTYVQRFKKKGTYVIFDKTTKKQMTLFVP
jgi:plastocyanin